MAIGARPPLPARRGAVPQRHEFPGQGRKSLHGDEAHNRRRVRVGVADHPLDFAIPPSKGGGGGSFATLLGS